MPPDTMTPAESPKTGTTRRPHWWIPIAATAGVIAFVTTLVGVAFAAGPDTPATLATASPSGVMDVSLRDISISPSMLEIPKGTKFTLHVRNDGAMAHDLVLSNGAASRMLKPGDEQTLDIRATDKDLDGWCTVAGHKAQGMVLHLHVVGTTSQHHAGTDEHSGDNNNAGTDAVIDFNAMPASNWRSRNPELAAVGTDREHRVTLRANETVLEVASGVRQEMWTFDGQVPGPTLRGKVGDTFIITLVNDGKMGHSIDFHAGKAAPDEVMRTLQPGESLEYRFQADYAGMFLYHCGTAPVLHHLGNGMYGAIVIDPPNLAPVDREFVMVQSELYTGPQNEPGDLTKMKSASPDAVMFNGYVNQYQFSPIQVNAHERIRVWVLDAGPSKPTSFHIIGTVFDTTFQEGSYSLRPDATHGGAQALGLQASQGGFVELSFDADGTYPFVTHAFADAARGAAGAFHVGNGTMSGMKH